MAMGVLSTNELAVASVQASMEAVKHRPDESEGSVGFSKHPAKKVPLIKRPAN